MFSCFCIVFWSSNSKADVPRGVKKYLDYAKKLMKSNKLQEADSVYSEGIKKYPNAPSLYYFRAKLRSEYMGNCEKAIPDYTMMIKINPRFNPKAYWRRGNCLYKAGLYQAAVDDYSRCLLLIPKYGRVHFLRARAYAKLGMIGNAKKDLDLTLKYDPSHTRVVNELWRKILTGTFQ